jgi:crotonobetainyl-CoA:carnitine CoA-transferase CaiB-like acyl-CoA transferase
VNPLVGHTFLALGEMRQRPLARYLESLGASRLEQPLDEHAAAMASFLIEDEGLARLADRGITRDLLQRWNPQLVHVSVTAFGSSGPHARWRGSELVVSAVGGTLRLTGEPDRPPVKEALDACLFHADMVAAAAAMAAHYRRALGGPGQHVDISAQEVAFSRTVNGILVWQFDQRKLHRVGGAINYGKSTVRCIWRLTDGWCFHTLMTGRFGAPANQALSDWMDEVGAANPLHGVDWLRYDRSRLDPQRRAQWEEAIGAFFAGRSRAEVLQEGRARGINACVLATPDDVLQDPHLQARDFWGHSATGKVPVRFARLRPGPQPAHSATAAAPAAAPRGPLSGIRVLDFSWALVGSISTKILGDLGAEVIKVESRSRPCLSRLDVQVSASQPGQLDDKPWFAHLNTSKRSLALDLKRPESREIIDPLIDWADVVVENFSPGTMAKLGLDYEQLVKRNPGVVMVSGSVFGQTGPLAHQWGVDGTGAALASRTYLTGWPDRDPVTPGAVPYGDVIVPYVMAACVLALLAQRLRSGQGGHIDASMYEICVQQMWPALQDAQRGATPQRIGNSDARYHWQGLLPASGTDRWVAVSVVNADQWRQVQALAGTHALADWTRTQTEQDLVRQLQGMGVMAGAVLDVEDLVADPDLLARRALVQLPHALLGPFGHVRTPMSFSADPCTPFQAPRIGEHTREVALKLAGLDAGRFAALNASGVLE